MALTAFGVIWVAMGFAYIMLVRTLEHGLALSILLVACTVANDTFAYFVGRAIGRHAWRRGSRRRRRWKGPSVVWSGR